MDDESARALTLGLEALHLEGVTGYRVSPKERRVLVGLAGGPLSAQVASGPDGDDILEQHFGRIAETILPVLVKHAPGKQWSSGWAKDDRGYFESGGGGSVLIFEWR